MCRWRDYHVAGACRWFGRWPDRDGRYVLRAHELLSEASHELHKLMRLVAPGHRRSQLEWLCAGRYGMPKRSKLERLCAGSKLQVLRWWNRSRRRTLHGCLRRSHRATNHGLFISIWALRIWHSNVARALINIARQITWMLREPAQHVFVIKDLRENDIPHIAQDCKKGGARYVWHLLRRNHGCDRSHRLLGWSGEID